MNAIAPPLHPSDARARFCRVFDLIDADDLEHLGDVVGLDVVDHQKVLGQGDGLPGLAFWARTLRQVLPDLTATVLDTVVEGDKVAGRILFAGAVLEGLAPAHTEAWVEFELHVTVRFEDDLIVEWWDASDTVQLLRDLGFGLTAPRGSSFAPRPAS